MSRQTAVRRLALAAVLLFDLFLALAVPYSSTDDWLWGMEEGLRWWLGGLLNGRYAGNFFAVIMCRAPRGQGAGHGGDHVFDPLVHGPAGRPGGQAEGAPPLPGLPRRHPADAPHHVAGELRLGVRLRQLCDLGAGLLVWLLALRWVADARPRMGPWSVLLFFLALTAGLFVENLTILFLGASLILALYALKDRALRLPFWACLAGSALAAALMFGNGLFSDLAATGTALNGLRELTFSPEDGPLRMAASVLSWYIGRLLPIAFLRGIHMALPLAVLTACAFWNSRLRPLALLGLLPLALNALVMSDEVYATPGRVAASCAAWLLPAAALLVQRDEGRTRVRRLLLYLAAPLSLLPLAATTTLGQRLYFFPMVLLILAARRRRRPSAGAPERDRPDRPGGRRPHGPVGLAQLDGLFLYPAARPADPAGRRPGGGHPGPAPGPV